MTKKKKGVQITSELHAALMVEKISLLIRKQNPNVIFQELLEDVFERASGYDYTVIGLIEKHPETEAWLKEEAKEIEFDYLLFFLEEDKQRPMKEYQAKQRSKKA